MSEPRTGSPLPEIQIVRGEPSEEELAALIVVLGGLARAAAAEPPVARCAWADPAHRLRTPLRPGPRRLARLAARSSLVGLEPVS